MRQQRWLRIIPVALIMYTISYVDRTNISLALDPTISTMMKDLLMDDKMKGEAAGIFFFGYILLQLPGGFLASRWSARKAISIFLVSWGVCAVGCGLAQTFAQFETMRFLLGVAEGGVFPATVVLLAGWFPRAERARANAYWNLCQPLAVAGSAPVTGWLLGYYTWHTMIMIEGMLPFVWLPIWWFYISDRPSEAKWISPEERSFLETTLQKEEAELHAKQTDSASSPFRKPFIFVMVAIYFVHNAATYGPMTFFTNTLKGRGYDSFHYGLLFAVPYAAAAVIMILVSRHSDKTRERRYHVAAVYCTSGVSLILSVLLQQYFWPSYALRCLSVATPFAAMGPLWTIPSESLPRKSMGLVVGLVNACGNLGGFAGPYIAGWLTKIYHSTSVAFVVLGLTLLVAAGLAFLLPKPAPQVPSLA